MAKTLYIPAALKYQAELSELIESIKKAGSVSATTTALLAKITTLTDAIYAETNALEAAIGSHAAPATLIGSMNKLREQVDALEAEMPNEWWPVPTYEEMLFVY